MKRDDAVKHVGYVVDDAGCGRKPGDDVHAIVRVGGDKTLPSREREGHEYPSVLVGWQCGFEPLFVAVHSYLDVRVDDEEAEELAADWLEEIGWFGQGGRRDCDYLIR